MSYPESGTNSTGGSPGNCCPASRNRVSRPRIWAAVTSVGSSSGPERTTSSGPVHEERPPPRAAATW